MTNLILVIAEIVDHHVVVDLLVSDIVLSSGGNRFGPSAA